jgi:ketosteroid isomerase-like protein
MSGKADVESFLRQWAAAMQARDAERAADLYLRDPAALVTFSDGERSEDWLDVRLRLQRDLERVVVERVEVHDVQVREILDAEALLVSFAYDMQVRDMWGLSSTATRHATLTLVPTKDGLRIAAGHYASA